MGRILHIETSTTMCSVAIGIDGKLAACFEINDGYSHAEEIESLIEKSLSESNLSINDLDAVCVSKGPGSYTGLRIGVSLAKGICYGKSIPLISIPTLESMARNTKVLESKSDLLIPMLDARRMEVYTCTLNALHAVVKPTEALVLESNSFEAIPAQKTAVLFGPGSEKAIEFYSHKPNFSFVENVVPSAREMIELGEEKYKKMDFEDVAYFEPFYLKNFVAGKPKKLL